jgi:hypothetical protein
MDRPVLVPLPIKVDVVVVVIWAIVVCHIDPDIDVVIPLTELVDLSDFDPSLKYLILGSHFLHFPDAFVSAPSSKTTDPVPVHVVAAIALSPILNSIRSDRQCRWQLTNTSTLKETGLTR